MGEGWGEGALSPFLSPPASRCDSKPRGGEFFGFVFLNVYFRENGWEKEGENLN